MNNRKKALLVCSIAAMLIVSGISTYFYLHNGKIQLKDQVSKKSGKMDVSDVGLLNPQNISGSQNSPANGVGAERPMNFAGNLGVSDQSQ